MGNRKAKRPVSVVIAALSGLVLAMSAAPASAVVEAGPIVNPANGHAYYLLTPATWSGARAQAVLILGGELVTINDAAENDWVWTAFAAYPGPYWMGLNFDTGVDNFVWASGAPVTYLNWALGQPDDLLVPGVAAVMTPEWDDEDGSFSLHRAVVEVFHGCSLTGTWGSSWSLVESGGMFAGVTYDAEPIGGFRADVTVSLALLHATYGLFTFAGTMTGCDTLVLRMTGPLSGVTFTLTRTRTTYCGDNIVDPGETCDDGNFIDNDSCSVACNPLSPCGNGVLDPGEDCDDGNSIEKDACLTSCELNACGDGHVRIGVEICDDGNTAAGDGCAANCTLETETVTGDVSTGIVGTQGPAGATPSDPVETMVWLSPPRSGTISITEQAAPPNATSGFVFMGTQVQVTATNLMPAPSATDPIWISFRFHWSVVPTGLDASGVDVLKDGILLQNCGASPPCVAARQDEPDGILIVVLTPSLSDWDFSTSICGEGPLLFGCQPALSAKLKLKEDGDEDRLTWRWKSSRLMPASQFGAPGTANDYTLCLYDAGGHRLQLSVPAGGMCGATPCWRPTLKGFHFVDPQLAADGVRRLLLKSGGAGKASLLVKALGPALGLPSLPLALPVMAQLRSRDGACWEAYFPTAMVNDPNRFQARIEQP